VVLQFLMTTSGHAAGASHLLPVVAPARAVSESRIKPRYGKPGKVYLKCSPVSLNKATELSDFSVCTTWGIAGKDLYLLDVLRRRMEYPELSKHPAEAAG
jgi:hypothetical protein